MRTSPIDDLTYDVLTVLHAKAKALEAYEKYIRDAQADDELHELFESLRRQDEEDVRQLAEVLSRRLDDELGLAEEEDEDEVWDEEGADEDEQVEDEGANERRSGAARLRRGESTQRRT